jgi:TolB protein
VYASNFSGAWELYTVSTNQQFQQLTGYGASTGAPAWSPDGARIAFLSNRDGNWSLYVMQFDGSNTIKLADFGTTLVPAWQSDRIVWSR